MYSSPITRKRIHQLPEMAPPALLSSPLVDTTTVVEPILENMKETSLHDQRQYELVLSALNADEQPEIGKIYVSIANSTIKYMVKDPRGTLVNAAIDAIELKTEIPKYVTELPALLPNILSVTSNRGHTNQNLPYPLNIRDLNTAQLAYWHNRPATSAILRAMLVNIAQEIIEKFSHRNGVTCEHFANLAPLATMENAVVIQQLLEAMAKKISSDRLIDEAKLSAIALMIQYAVISEESNQTSVLTDSVVHDSQEASETSCLPDSAMIMSFVGDTAKLALNNNLIPVPAAARDFIHSAIDSVVQVGQNGLSEQDAPSPQILFSPTALLLRPSDVITIIELVAKKVNLIMSDSQATLRGLRSLNHLLDAALALKTSEVDVIKMPETTAVFRSLMNSSDSLIANEAQYTQQAFMRVTAQATDVEKAVGASYQLVNGTLQLAFAIMDKSPAKMIDSLVSIYGASLDFSSAVAGSKYPWFSHARAAKVMLQYDIQTFFNYLHELIHRQTEKKSYFSSSIGLLPKELIIHLVGDLDKVICDRQVTAKVFYPYQGHRTAMEMPAREAVLRLLGDMFSQVNIYGKDASIRILVLERLSQYCSLPEAELQRAAKEVAHHVYVLPEEHALFPSLLGKKERLATRYWPVEALIDHQSPSALFPYIAEPPMLTNIDVSTAFENKYPVEFLLEGMRSQVKEFITTNLSDDMATYIPVNASMSATQKDVFDLFDHVKKFMASDNQNVLLIHGNAGSGKSLFGRHLQCALWESYAHGEQSYVPVFISLAALQDPVNGAIKTTLKEMGFSHTQIAELRDGNIPVLFILDGFDEIQMKVNLYATNKFKTWKNSKVIITARTEYLLGLGNYVGYFAESEKKAIDEYYIRPFDHTQRTDFFQKMIAKRLSTYTQVSQYHASIASIDGLSKLADNPFMLRIIAEILPTLVKERDEQVAITRALIYAAFMQREFQQKKEKLRDKSTTLVIPKDFDEITSFEKFSMNLAVNMFVFCTNSVVTHGSDYRFDDELEDYWDKFFSEKHPSLIASRFGAPLIKMGRQQTFRHKSLLEYFTAKMLVKELANAAKLAEPIKITSFINRRSVHEEPSMMRFMTEMMATEPEVERTLWTVLEYSKKIPEIAVAAGNALTLLVSIRRSLAGKDFRGIHTKGAKVDGGDFTGTNFVDAHFENTSWDGANLNKADFSNAFFNNNLIEECAALASPFNSFILSFVVLEKYDLVLATTASGSALMWHKNEWCALDQVIKCKTIDHSPDQRWVVFKGDKAYLFDAQSKAVVQAPELLQAKYTNADERSNIILTNNFCIVTSRCVAVHGGGWRPNQYKTAFDYFPLRTTCLHLDQSDINSFDNFISVSENECVAISKNGLSTFTLMHITPSGLDCVLEKSVLNHDANIASPVSLLGEYPYLFFINHSRNITLLCSKTLKDISVQGLAQLGPIDSYCISSSGQYLLLKKDKLVYVFLVHINNTLTLQLLYQMENVTQALSSQQFSSDERYIAWGCDHTVLVTKVRELAVVQSIELRETKKIIHLSFSQARKENNLIILQENNCELLRIRVDANDLETLDSEFSANHSHQELSSIDANFITARGLSREDRMLLQERGGRFVSEEELITQYQSTSFPDEKQSILLKAFFYRYHRFVNTVDWDPSQCMSGSSTSLAQYLVSQQRNDAHYNHYLISLVQEHNLPLNLKDTQSNTALHLAAQKGHTLTCICLLDQGADMESINQEGLTAFRMAAINGHITTCELFLDRGMDVDSVGDKHTALFDATNNGQEAICALLLARGANINHPSYNGSTPLRLLVQNHHLSLFALFIPYEQDKRNLNVLLFDAASTGFREACQMLLDHGADINCTPDQGHFRSSTPLMRASHNGHAEVCALLLDQGARYGDGFTELGTAVQGGCERVVELFISRNLCRNSYSRLLYEAAAYGQLNLCQLFLDNEVSIGNYNGQPSILMLLAQHVRGESIRVWLLEHGEQINYTDEAGDTALLYAVKRGIINNAVFLLNRGADPEIANNKGKTPLSIAIEHFGEEHEVIRLMKEKILLKQSVSQLTDTNRSTLASSTFFTSHSVSELVKQDEQTLTIS